MTITMLVVFGLLGTTTLALAAYRFGIERTKGDDCLHLLDADAPVVARQELAARRLETIDVLGKAFTMATVLAGITAYVVWWLGV